MSYDFPEEFSIQKETLGHGIFGSVHLVKDINHPKGNKFVAKRLNLNNENDMVSFHQADSETA